MISRKQILAVCILCIPSSFIFGEQTLAPITNDQISVIFDLGGVLVETKGTLQVIGIQRFIAYALTQNPLTITSHIKKRLFEFLHAIEERHPHEIDARDERGDLLPQCMCNWLKGTQTPEQLRMAVDEELARRPQNLETSILRDIAYMMFTPTLFCQTQHLVPTAVEFAQSLKRQGYKLYILSNLCSESFAVIRNRHSEFFDLFDGIMISADVGFFKPDPNIYGHILKTYNINPATACFIDDTLINVQTAQNVGIHSILCPLTYGYISGGSPDIAFVKREFQLWRDMLTIMAQQRLSGNIQ